VFLATIIVHFFKHSLGNVRFGRSTAVI